jgi:hypothetical protein
MSHLGGATYERGHTPSAGQVLSRGNVGTRLRLVLTIVAKLEP